MRALAGALGFFSTLPVGRDERSFEALRRNLWILPVVGLILGTMMSAMSYLFYLTRFPYMAVLSYLALEGINHVDALADFGDALFAPKDRKLKALKDLNTGVGGTTVVVVYLLGLAMDFERRVSPMTIIDAQIMAKFGMLIMLTTTEPLWDGMGAYMMEFAGLRDLIVGLAFVLAITFLTRYFVVNAIAIVICFVYRFYVLKTFGGVNGDLIGALNCITFLLVMTIGN